MGRINIDGILLTPLKNIYHDQGNIYHGMKQGDPGFSGFGEAYFSTVKCGAIKAWKRHNKMTLNLIVPIGEVKFVAYDDRIQSKTSGNFFEVNLSIKNYQRLTVPFGIWMGFQGISKEVNMLLNIADIKHDLEEEERVSFEEIEYDWN